MGKIQQMQSLQVYIPPAHIPYSEKYRGLKLMEHQSEMKEAKEKLVILDAPTSSGKTLAMLVRLIECGGNGLFLYPTNELITDQANAIKDLLEKMNISSVVLPSNGILSTELSSEDVVIFVATGESLEGIARTKGEALREFFTIDNTMIMLSNIDVLTLIFKERYRGRHILPELLYREWILAIDEFHMYSGIALANLLYLTWILRNKFSQIMVSSATHHDGLELLKRMFEHRVITPTVLTEGGRDTRQIRHPCHLHITEHDFYGGVESIYEAVMELNPEHRDPVLAIVDSVASSEVLADMLEEQGLKVGRVSGFVPKECREREGDVVVGTRAIEVGIDFDMNKIVFEAKDAHTFIQRLGRVARYHDNEGVEGTAKAFVHPDSMRLLRENLREETPINELGDVLIKSMPELKTYSSLASSKYGALLLAGLLYHIAQLKKGKTWGELKKELLNRIYNEMFRPPFLKEEAIRELEKLLKPRLLKTVYEGGARGDIMSVKAYIEKYRTYMNVDILELVRADVDFNRDVAVKAWRMNERLKAYNCNMKLRRIDYIEVNRIHWSARGKLMKIISEKLNGKLAYLTLRRPDWRFSYVECQGRYLVLGLDALIQCYVEEEGSG